MGGGEETAADSREQGRTKTPNALPILIFEQPVLPSSTAAAWLILDI